MAISKQEAIRVVEELFNEGRHPSDVSHSGPIVVMDEYTIDKPYGWIFFWNTLKFHETKDRKFSIVGGGRSAFETSDSSITILPSYLDTQDAIEEYEKNRDKS
ncbi:MAG TPA: hypothetical protein VF627_03570 [Abditibacterium sp.]|jgi:hypothetical protein